MKEREILTRGPGRGMPRRARVRDLVSGARAWLARSAALAALLLTMPSAAQAQGTEQSETIATTCETPAFEGLTVEGTHFTISNYGTADKCGMTANISDGITVWAKGKEWITKVVITCGDAAKYVTETNTTVSSGKKTISGDDNEKTITVTNVNATTFYLKCSAENGGPTFSQFVVYYVPTYSVSLKDGTDDDDKWTAKAGEGEAKALPLEGVAEGEKVTLQYEGRKRVMSVRATKKVVWDGDLSKLTGSEPEGFATATNGMTITGTLADGVNVKVMIADRATVTLSGATINGVNDTNCEWAGLNCLGDATIVLVGTNKVKGFYTLYPGIYVPENKMLTIRGDGSLDASSNGYGAGIGGGQKMSCGHITIEGGSITATGSYGAAGIGSGFGAQCGEIRITGGTVEAKGGEYAAGIGSGYQGSCGTVTITNTVTKVKATKGNEYAPCSIGKGRYASCGTVTIGCTIGTDGNPVDVTGKEGMVETSPYTYYPATTDLSTLTADYTAQDGETLTGTLQGNVKISIAEGATVTLSGATIEGTNVEDAAYKHAGITCLGDATIVLSGTNKVKGFYENYPGIHVPEKKTLTISGDGSLDASSNGWGSGIGGGYEIACGNITIEGGTITATGGSRSAGIGGADKASCGDILITGGTVEAKGVYDGAGIGSGEQASCGDILITGGTVEATGGKEATGIGSGYGKNASCGDIRITGGTVEAKGGEYAAGIGGGSYASCGDIRITGGTVEAKGGEYAAGIGGGSNATCLDITITSGVTKVTATKGEDAPNSIGKGLGGNAKCGTVTIGCTLGTDDKPVAGTGTVYWDGSKYVNGGDTYLSQSPLTYPEPKLGDLYYSDGTWSSTLVAGKTPIGVIAYLGTDEFTETGTKVGGSTFTGHGLVLCLKNAASGVKWSTRMGTDEFEEGPKVESLDDLKRTTDVSGYKYTATLAAKAGAVTYYPAAWQAKNYTDLAAPAGTTGWFLPSAQQWVKMQEGLGGLVEDDITWKSWFNNDHTAATAWETAMAKAGEKGTAYDSVTDDYLWYWSSSEYSKFSAVYLEVNATGTGSGNGFYWGDVVKDDTNTDFRVRPVLAF